MYKAEHLTVDEVEAYTASWIEMCTGRCISEYRPVEAYTASWIEIFAESKTQSFYQSKPIRLRGLKSTVTSVTIAGAGRSLYGFVD